MNTSKIAAMMIIFLLGIALVPAQVLQDIPRVGVVLLNQDPDPVRPGEYVELRFRVTNSGTTPANGVVFEIVPTFPFSLDPNENPVRQVGTLAPSGSGQYATTLRFKVRVSQDAVEGDNEIQLRYKLGNSDWIVEDYDVSIKTVDATVAIEQVETVPSTIAPGERARVDITVMNLADSTVRDVSMKLDLTLSSLVSQATAGSDPLAVMNSVPFSPVGSATEKKVRMIGPEDEHVFSFTVVANSDADSRVYKIPVQLRYFNEQDEEIIKNDVIGLVIGTEPDLLVSIESSDMSQSQRRGDISFRIVNRGLSDVKLLDVSLQPTSDFEVLTTERVYIGNIDSDDYETAEYTLYLTSDMDPKAQESKVVMLPLLIRYKDTNNENYEMNMSVPLKLLPANRLAAQQGNPMVTLIIVALVLGGAWYIFRKMRRSKRKE